MKVEVHVLRYGGVEQNRELTINNYPSYEVWNIFSLTLGKSGYITKEEIEGIGKKLPL